MGGGVVRLFRKESGGVSVVLVGMVVLFFFPAFFLGRVPAAVDVALARWPIFRKSGDTGHWVSRNDHMTDVVTQFEPWYLIGRRALKGGSLLLWNPWNGCGAPHVANMQSAVLYPGTWLVYLLGLRWGLTLLYTLKLWAVGLCTYGYLRVIGTRAVVALLGAMGFMFSGFVMRWLPWPLPNVVFFLPLSLMLMEKYLIGDFQPFRFAVTYGLGFAVAFFGGYPELLFYIVVFGALYCVVRSWGRGWRGVAVNVGVLTGANLLGLALAAVQLFPSVEYFRNSFEWVLRQPVAMNWRSAMAFLIPDFYGNPAGIPMSFYGTFMHRSLGPFVGTYNDYTGGYVGISLLLLGVAGALRLWRKDPYVPFFAVSILVAAAILYKAPLIHELMTQLPFFSRTRGVRLTLWIGFSLVVLAVRYVEALWTSGRSSSVGFVAVVALGVVVGMLLLWLANWAVLVRLDLPYSLGDIGKLQICLLALTVVLALGTVGAVGWLVSGRRRWGYLLLFGLVGLQTGVHGWLYQPQIPGSRVEEVWGEMPAVFADIHRMNGSDPTPWRTTTIGGRPWSDFFGYKITSLYPANSNGPYGIWDIRNYDSIQVGRYRHLLSKVASGYLFHWTDFKDIRRSFLDFVGVKYLVSDLDPNEGDPGHWVRVRDYGGYSLWVNRRVRPRAFLAPGVIWVETGEEALRRVGAGDFDWGGAVVLERRGSRGWPAGTYLEGPKAWEVRFRVYRPHVVKLEVWADRPGFLVLSDVMYPGWKAWVDGRRAEVWTANYAFRAVYVGAGRHEVEFRYVPASLWWGAGVSGVTLAGLAAALVRQRFRARAFSGSNGNRP